MALNKFLDDIPVEQQDERGFMLECGSMYFISRKAGTVSADHSHPDEERLYLVQGTVDLHVGDEVQTVEAPKQLYFPSAVYHKLIAITDGVMLLDRDGLRE